MSKYDRIEKVGLVIISCAAFAFGLIPTVTVLKRIYHPTHKLTDFSKASEEEKKALSVFYDSDLISEGKYFDLKFTYFEPCTDESAMEIVKKTDADLGKIYIETWSENEEFISGRTYGGVEDSELFGRWSRNNQQYLLFLYGSDFLNDHDTDIRYKDDILIKAKICYDQYAEDIYEVRFDLKKSFQELERHKKDPITNIYEGQLATYYYGLLLSYDKERWFQEVNKLIEEDKNKYLDYPIILKTSSNTSSSIRNGKYQDLQDLYQFNDEEYAEYQRMVQRASEKDLFKNSAG